MWSDAETLDISGTYGEGGLSTEVQSTGSYIDVYDKLIGFSISFRSIFWRQSQNTTVKIYEEMEV